jgi:hypothetical protein
MPTQSHPPAAPEPPGSFLFSDDVIQELTDQEQRHGIYTGERCPEDLRRAIIKFVGDGWSQREIARTLKTAPQTVRNVAHMFKADIRDYCEQLPRRLQRCIISGLDRLERNIDSVPMQSMGITLKALHDIETMASGRASARVEHVHRVDLFSHCGSWDEFISTVDDSPEAIRAKNEGPEIHLEAGKKSAIDAELIESREPADGQAEIDDKSLVSSHLSQATPTTLPTYLTTTAAADHAADADARARGTGTAGGGFDQGGALHGAKGNGSQKFLGNGT